jgi:aminopeptidase N
MWAVVHENAHQWFGDSVTMRRWNDIWLAEGFATYSEWLWSQDQHQGSAENLFLASYHEHPTGNSIWEQPLNRPFFALDIAPYQRGAMLLQALRNRIGSPEFFRVMRTWVRRHGHANGSSAQFAALAEKISGEDLSSFFDAWLYAARRPAPTVANGLPPGARGRLAAGTVPPPVSLAAISRTDAALDRDRWFRRRP